MNILKLNLTLNKTKNKNAKGFTIIEVVLVLAIAGLIFLMVFIALPALQRSQRDTQRKNQMNALLDAYERCRSNNRGQCWINTAANYIPDDEFKDPSTGERYTWGLIGSDANNADKILKETEIGQISFDAGAGCDQNGNPIDISPSGDPRQNQSVNIITRLEGGGLICVSNQQVNRK